MVGPMELEHSRALILRAKKRLSYQREIVARLGFNNKTHYADTVRDIHAVMQAKLDSLTKQHGKLVEEEGRVLVEA